MTAESHSSLQMRHQRNPSSPTLVRHLSHLSVPSVLTRTRRALLELVESVRVLSAHLPNLLSTCRRADGGAYGREGSKDLPAAPGTCSLVGEPCKACGLVGSARRPADFDRNRFGSPASGAVARFPCVCGQPSRGRSVADRKRSTSPQRSNLLGSTGDKASGLANQVT